MIAGKFAGGEGSCADLPNGAAAVGRVITLVALCTAAWLTKEGTGREVGRTLTVWVSAIWTWLLA
jgi:hypothetical protein